MSFLYTSTGRGKTSHVSRKRASSIRVPLMLVFLGSFVSSFLCQSLPLSPFVLFFFNSPVFEASRWRRRSPASLSFFGGEKCNQESSDSSRQDSVFGRATARFLSVSHSERRALHKNRKEVELSSIYTRSSENTRERVISMYVPYTSDYTSRAVRTLRRR